MYQVTIEEINNPALCIDSEVVAFWAHFDSRSPLDEIVRQAAQKMLQAAIGEEIEAYLESHADRRDDQAGVW